MKRGASCKRAVSAVVVAQRARGGVRAAPSGACFPVQRCSPCSLGHPTMHALPTSCSVPWFTAARLMDSTFPPSSSLAKYIICSVTEPPTFAAGRPKLYRSHVRVAAQQALLRVVGLHQGLLSGDGPAQLTTALKPCPLWACAWPAATVATHTHRATVHNDVLHMALWQS
jgi:hypothetical protein